MNDAVTREEFEMLRNLVGVAIMLLSKVVSEHPFCDAPAGDEEAIYARLKELRRSPEALDSQELRWALDVLSRAIPYEEL